MTHSEDNAYILGTDREELHRLGLQHEVWSAEASRGWEEAGFGAGQTLLDLGCGPGFCTQELAYLTGTGGRVIGVDQSEGFIAFAQALVHMHQLNVELHCQPFDDFSLPPSSIDGAFCRWALAWVPNPDTVVSKVADFLRPGGVFVAQEYIDWAAFRVTPHKEALSKAVSVAFNSFEQSPGEIDVGQALPSLFESAGLEIIGTRTMSRVVTPGSTAWQWPDSFLESYFPRLVQAGLLNEETRLEAMEDWHEVSARSDTTCLCPTMIEVTGMKM